MTEPFKVPLEWNLPLSGAVTMPIAMPGSYGGQFGLFNINLGGSEDPALERKLIDAAGSYGRQIGHIQDVLKLLLKAVDRAKLSPDENDAIDAFELDLANIKAARKKHKAK